MILFLFNYKIFWSRMGRW